MNDDDETSEGEFDELWEQGEEFVVEVRPMGFTFPGLIRWREMESDDGVRAFGGFLVGGLFPEDWER